MRKIYILNALFLLSCFLPWSKQVNTKELSLIAMNGFEFFLQNGVMTLFLTLYAISFALLIFFKNETMFLLSVVATAFLIGILAPSIVTQFKYENMKVFITDSYGYLIGIISLFLIIMLLINRVLLQTPKKDGFPLS